jgi:DNA-binding transcriptional regulator YdaS (Cro superfamily)
MQCFNSGMDTKDEALNRAIDEAGGPSELARFITAHYPDFPITAQAICDWRQCPPRRVLQVEHAVRESKGKTTRHDIRPDLYPQERVA